MMDRATNRPESGEHLDKVIIRDLLVRGVIGLNDWERKVEQDILINLVLYVDTRAAGATDDPAHILDYKGVTKAVIGHVADHAPLLVERLAADIARICLARGAERVTVCVEKPGAVRFARSVGVEITRGKGDLAGVDVDAAAAVTDGVGANEAVDRVAAAGDAAPVDNIEAVDAVVSVDDLPPVDNVGHLDMLGDLTDRGD